MPTTPGFSKSETVLSGKRFTECAQEITRNGDNFLQCEETDENGIRVSDRVLETGGNGLMFSKCPETSGNGNRYLESTEETAGSRTRYLDSTDQKIGTGNRYDCASDGTANRYIESGKNSVNGFYDTTPEKYNRLSLSRRDQRYMFDGSRSEHNFNELEHLPYVSEQTVNNGYQIPSQIDVYPPRGEEYIHSLQTGGNGTLRLAGNRSMQNGENGTHRSRGNGTFYTSENGTFHSRGNGALHNKGNEYFNQIEDSVPVLRSGTLKNPRGALSIS